jgi:gliotoxin/aspirochlorine biosynthesis thioredoxin reductase
VANLHAYPEMPLTCESYHCLFCHGYEDRGAKNVGVLAVDMLAAVPPITNGLARNALQFSKDVTIYTNGSEKVAESLKPMVESKGIKIDTRPIKKLVKGANGPEVIINFEDGSNITQGFVVHTPSNKIELDFAKDLNLEVTPSGGELKVTPPFNETTEPGCFAAGDIASMAKIVVAGIAFGAFAATGIVKQLQSD